jgi:hypothetical protein
MASERRAAEATRLALRDEPPSSIQDYHGLSNSFSEMTAIKKEKCCCGLSRCRCLLVTTACTGILLGVAAAVVCFGLAPSMAQSSIKHSTLSLEHCTMGDATTTSIMIDCVARLDNAGGVAAILDEFAVEVMHSRTEESTKKEVFGIMTMPQTHVLADQPTFLNLSSRLNITDNALFTIATAGVLQGKQGVWTVRGSTTLHVSLGFQLALSVTMDKDLLLPPTLLTRVIADDFAVVGSNTTAVWATASTSLVSVSVLELQSLGELSFALHEIGTHAYIGEITIPDFSVRRGYNRFENITSVLSADPAAPPGSPAAKASTAAVQRFFKKYAAGDDIVLSLLGPTRCASGSPFLHGLVSQNVTVVSGGPLLSEMDIKSIEIAGGTEKALEISVSGSLQSAATVHKGAVGASTLVMYDTQQRTLGTISLPPDFGVTPGTNALSAVTHIIKDGTAENAAAINDFVTVYSAGKTQRARLVGPVHHANPLLDNFVDMQLELAGIPNPNLMLTSLLTKQSVGGFKTGGKTLRGAVSVATNPFPIDVALSNVTFDLYLHDPIHYRIKPHTEWTNSHPLTCSSTQFARAGSGKGMHMYPYLCDKKHCDPSKADVTSVELPASGQASFFTPAWEQPGQTVVDPSSGKPQKCTGTVVSILEPDDLDCCFLSLFFAASCRALKQGNAHFMTSTNGTMVMNISGFVASASVLQKDLSFSFEHEMVDGFILGGSLKCDDFEVLE